MLTVSRADEHQYSQMCTLRKSYTEIIKVASSSSIIFLNAHNVSFVIIKQIVEDFILTSDLLCKSLALC